MTTTVTWTDADSDRKLPYFRMWVNGPHMSPDWVGYVERKDWASTNCGPFRVFLWRKHPTLNHTWAQEPHEFETLEEAQRYAEAVWRMGV